MGGRAFLQRLTLALAASGVMMSSLAAAPGGSSKGIAPITGRAPKGDTAPVAIVERAVASGISREVALIEPSAPWAGPLQQLEVTNLEIREGSPFERTGRPRLRGTEPDADAAVVHPTGDPAPAPLLQFEGINNLQNAFGNGGFLFTPPDTIGDIGPSHYVQSVNITTRVFSRTGVPLTGTFKMSQLFASLSPSVCAVLDNGDPIVLYDQLADRWMISQFALPAAGNARVGPFHQCIAISTTGDPTGSYYLYDFVMPENKFNDYPHFGIWPNGLFMTIHQFNAAGTRFVGSGVFAFDRAKMWRGDPSASFVYFDLEDVDPNIFGLLPADADGTVPPPAGTPNVFVGIDADEFGGTDAVRLWEFNVNFANPGAATFTELPQLPVAAFNPSSPAGRDDIPQPPPAVVATMSLDAISDRMMNRVQYRNFGTHETLVALQTVDADATAAFRAAPRYYQLRRTPAGAGAWVVQDQATYTLADTTHRFMGSIAMDRAGNVGFGYSVSSASVFPGIRYAGKLSTDGPGIFQDEQVMINGGGSQLSTGSRWGDYSQMSIDPVDECTFWYTQEYYGSPNACTGQSAAVQAICWQTHVGAFRYPSCTSEPAAAFAVGRVTRAVGGQGVPNAIVSLNPGRFTATDGGGFYSLRLPPGGPYTLAVSKPGFVTTNAAVITTIASGGVTTRNVALPGAIDLSVGPPAVSGAPIGSSANGVIDVDECLVANATLINAGFANATNVQGVLSTTTPGVTIPQPNGAYGTVAAQSSAVASPPYLLNTDPSFVIGTPIALNLAVTSDQGPFNASALVPTGTADPTPQVFNADGPVAIDTVPDDVSLSIPVSGLTSAISNVRVAVHVTHTFVSDLRLSLISPDGTEVELFDGRGGSQVNIGTDCPVTDGDDTVFDDAAANPIGLISSTTPPGPAAPFVGSFRPEQPLSTFRGKSGAAANGTWTFRVIDFFDGDGGEIECVALTINGYTTVAGGCSNPPTDLAISKTDGVTGVQAGDSLTYTVVVTNTSAANGTSGTVTDTFPAALQNCSWTCVPTPGGTCGAGPVNGNIVADAVILPASGSATYTATCDVPASAAAGTLTNTATVTGSNDPNAANDSATDADTVVVPQVDVAVSKNDGVSSVTQGGSVTYTIVASNAASETATDVSVTDTFPAALTGCSWTCTGSGGSTCTAAGVDDIADTADITGGNAVTYTATCTVDAGASGPLANTASVSYVNDPNAANDSATDTDAIVPPATPVANLGITISNGGSGVTAGQNTTYTLVATNAGPGSATSAQVEGAFDASLTCTWTCVGAGGGTCTATGNGDINDSVALPNAASVTYTATCAVPNAATGTITSSAVISSTSVIDGASGNNTASDTDTVTPSSDNVFADGFESP